MTEAITGVPYAATAFGWIAYGRDTLTLVEEPVDRESLILGEYIPGEGTAGLIDPDATFTEVNAGPNGYCDLTSTTPYVNMIFFGSVRPRVEGVQLINCILAGGDPALTTGGASCLQNYGSSPFLITMIDCLLSQEVWHTRRGRTTWRRACYGVDGCMFIARRCEVTHVEDGFHLTGPGAGDPWRNVGIMEGNWVHYGQYSNALTVPSDGQPHCDAIQFNTGKNWRIVGNMLGGQRVQSGYRVWPGGYNAGDDFWNACIMFKQEVSDTAPQTLIENVLIEKNFLCGGTASLNHAAGATSPQKFATSIVRDNKIFTRGNDWGANRRASTTAGDPNVYQENPGPPTGTPRGYYIIKQSSILAAYSNNTIYETGAPAPIANG